MAVTLVSTGITFPDGTTQTTAASGSTGVTSLNGQTGAITNTAKNAIGSYVIAFPAIRNTPSTLYTIGSSTISGSSLGQYVNNGTSAYNYGFISPGSGGYTTKSVTEVSSVTNLGLTGTWRAMGQSRNYFGAFGKDSGDTAVSVNFWVRIS